VRFDYARHVYERARTLIYAGSNFNPVLVMRENYKIFMTSAQNEINLLHARGCLFRFSNLDQIFLISRYNVIFRDLQGRTLYML
jgi:hypothetical protein